MLLRLIRPGSWCNLFKQRVYVVLFEIQRRVQIAISNESAR